MANELTIEQATERIAALEKENAALTEKQTAAEQKSAEAAAEVKRLQVKNNELKKDAANAPKRPSFKKDGVKYYVNLAGDTIIPKIGKVNAEQICADEKLQAMAIEKSFGWLEKA